MSGELQDRLGSGADSSLPRSRRFSRSADALCACLGSLHHQSRFLACRLDCPLGLEELDCRIPDLASVFWRETIIETTILREWICNAAARDALASIAHLICEVAARLEAVGLVSDGSFHLPLTQQDLANASGFSVVHVNRTLQELRKRHLVRWENRTVTVLDFEELKRIAEFDPDYLFARRP
ncbi:winged helix-turn-helix domain-containing protein [Bradyrhizobium diazoefficiens]|nr:winged helix-turn-helix domain-containing protein [Bradyrhizobium diazoefficiens]